MGLGIAPLVLLHSAGIVFKVLGIVYLTVAILRAFSVGFDRSVGATNILFLLVEATFSVLFLI